MDAARLRHDGALSQPRRAEGFLLVPLRRRGQTRWVLLIGAAAGLAANSLCARPALAAGSFKITVTGGAIAQGAVVPMGKSPTATVLPKSIRLDWAPSLYGTGREVRGYAVRRQVVGSTDAVQVCTVASPMRACEDSPPTGQPVTYTVVPTEQLWHGPASAPSNPVTLPAPTLAVVAALPSPSVTPSPDPTASPTPAATPSATPTPSPTATPPPTPSATAAPSPTATPTPAAS
jgi:hypothetical protein